MPDARPSDEDLAAMLPVVSWRVYYADGSTVDGVTLEQWRAAPSLQVQGVVAFHDLPWGSTAMHGHDAYWLPGWGLFPKLGSLLADELLQPLLDRIETERRAR